MKRKKAIGERLPAPNKTRPSDVLAIPLGKGFFGYVRVCKGCNFFQILTKTSKGILCLADVIGSPICEYLQFYEPYDESPWVYLGKWPFINDDESWGPAIWYGVPFKYIEEKGSFRKVLDSEIVGVRKSESLHPDQLVDKMIDLLGLKISKKERSRIRSGDS